MVIVVGNGHGDREGLVNINKVVIVLNYLPEFRDSVKCRALIDKIKRGPNDF